MYSDPTEEDLGSMDEAHDPGTSSEAVAVSDGGDAPEALEAAPAVDAAESSESTEPVQTVAEAAPAVVRSPTALFSFKSEMARAMQVVADQERDRIDAGVGEQETAQVEKIHVRAAAESAQLSKHADEDVSLIDAWYDHEVKRIREEADRRIDDRRAGLAQALTHHGSLIDAEIESVHEAVERYRASLNGFFGRLAEEQDPSVIARLAGTLPELPDLDAARAEARAAAMRALDQGWTVVETTEQAAEDSTNGSGPVELERELVPVMDPDLVRERVSILSGMAGSDAAPAEAASSTVEADAEPAAAEEPAAPVVEAAAEEVAVPVRASIWSSWKGNSEGQ